MDTIQLLIIDTVLIIINILISFIFLPLILDILDYRIKKIREFIDKNDGFFSICFICLFAFEQILLIVITYPIKDINKFRLIISFFALIVMTTASFQKFILKKKRQYDKERSNTAKKAINILEKITK